MQNKAQTVSNAADDSPFNQVEIVGFVVGLQWFRVFLILKASKLLGPMIEIVICMVKRLFVFAILLVLIIAIYVFVGCIYFASLEEFKTYPQAFLYLFESMLGAFDFTLYENESIRVRKIYWFIYMISYLIIVMVVFLNFLIAVLSDIYADLQGRSKQLYLSTIVQISHVLEDHPYYS